MHELGVLKQVVKTVSSVAEDKGLKKIRHITLEVGQASGFEPIFLEKLYPVAVDSLPMFEGSSLKISMTAGGSLLIKEIGY